MKEQLKAAVQKNIDWFLNSGIMRPDDGFWGVAERIVTGVGDKVREEMNFNFPYQTELDDKTFVLEHRRADCAVETAVMFSLAAEYFNDRQYQQIAENIIEFLFNRSGLYTRNDTSPHAGLWEWAMPKFTACWTDDNSWLVIGLLYLESRGFGTKLKKSALTTAQAMYKHNQKFLEFLEENGRDALYPVPHRETMHGLCLNPHWLGLVTMALALADSVEKKRNYYGLVKKYYATVLDGPQAWDKLSSCKTENGIDWSLSEYAYLALTATVVAKVYNDKSIAEIAAHAGNILLERQDSDGHFSSNHFESPAGEHLADLIYTQNWALLALLHLALYFPENSGYWKAYEKTAAFLIKIQDNSNSLSFKGCWRGMYDCEAGTWGGGDKYEGGQSSIYSGWTNAPISIAFLFKLCSKSFLPD